jgi:hypothetical protein
MDNQTPETVRTAAYLAARERLDARSAKGPKCNPPNRVCGDRCIPPNWNCRVKGEGTDSHSRVVAGDPLAGAASIARGRRRLVTGFKKGSLVDIQGGRAAIERGIVKAVPGQNIKQKEALRKNVNKVLLPVATAVFGIWALQRGHEGMKLLVPQYRNGIGRDIETSMTSAVSWGLDRVPFSGQLRVQQRRRAGLEAQRLGRAVSRGVSFDPANAGGGERYFPHVSTRERRAFTGLDTAINEAYARKGSGNYANFRSDLMGSTIGVNVDGKSLYSEVATAHHLARQFSIDPSTITNRDGAGSRFHIENRLSTALTSARNNMRQDMLQRGLDPKNATDVNRYVEIARSSAAPRMRGLNPDQQQGAGDMLGGYIRDIVSVGKTSKDEISTRTIASGIFEETQKGFDKSFGDFARTIKEDTSPITRVIASGEAGASIRTALVGTANRVKRDVGLEDSYTIRGANHAELVLQKVWYEKVVPGNYSGRTRSTWNATSDGAIRYAAQDMGWTGSNTDDAVEFLRANGFPRLARRPSGAAASRPARPATGAERPARRRLRSRSELISMLTRGTNGLSPEAAAAEADRIIARRGDEDDFAPELVRTATYLAARADFKENPRLGKPCGASHIAKAHECRKGRSTETSTSPENGRPSNLGRKIAIAAVVAAVGAVGVTVALDAHRFYSAKDLPNPPGYREAIRAAQAGDPKVGYDVAIGRHYDKVVTEQGWQPGELVYTRYGSGSGKKDPTGHFAVYMGKQGDRHQFADFGIRNSAQREGEVNLYEYGPGSKGVAPFVFVKAPPLKRGTEPYSSEQIQQRVFSSLGARMKYDALDNNCETWARMITTGQPRSAQVERLSAMTRSLYRFYDRKTAGAPPKDIPSVKQQARILDMQARVASGDKSARADLKAFQALIKQGKRTDGMQQDTEGDLPTPAELLNTATSDVDALIRTKMYLMLLIRQGEARAYGSR